jgi:hypothetical protein
MPGMMNLNTSPLKMKTSFVRVFKGTAHGIAMEMICWSILDTKLIAVALQLTNSTCRGSKKVLSDLPSRSLMSNMIKKPDRDFRSWMWPSCPIAKDDRESDDCLKIANMMVLVTLISQVGHPNETLGGLSGSDPFGENRRFWKGHLS